MFFVGKQDGRLRMTLDAWLVKLIARCPPKVYIALRKSWRGWNRPCLDRTWRLLAASLRERERERRRHKPPSACRTCRTASDFRLTSRVFESPALQSTDLFWVASRSLPMALSWSSVLLRKRTFTSCLRFKRRPLTGSLTTDHRRLCFSPMRQRIQNNFCVCLCGPPRVHFTACWFFCQG